jgi:hypothetical protein
MAPSARHSRVEAIGLVVSGIATTVAVGAIVVDASQMCLLATLVGLAALWPAIHEGSRR